MLNQNAESLVKENSGPVRSHQSFQTVLLLSSLCSDVQKSVLKKVDEKLPPKCF